MIALAATLLLLGSLLSKTAFAAVSAASGPVAASTLASDAQTATAPSDASAQDELASSSEGGSDSEQEEEQQESALRHNSELEVILPRAGLTLLSMTYDGSACSGAQTQLERPPRH